MFEEIDIRIPFSFRHVLLWSTIFLRQLLQAATIPVEGINISPTDKRINLMNHALLPDGASGTIRCEFPSNRAWLG